MEWDSENKGPGKTNVGVPQGLPLSPIVFLIFMAPIMDEMETTSTKELNIDIEIPSYLNNFLVCILDKEGETEMKGTLKKIDIAVNQVATKWNLPLENGKHEKIMFNPGGRESGRKKKRTVVENFFFFLNHYSHAA